DRFNYGDLLFPQMIEYAFEKQMPGEFQFTCYSLVGADYSSVGGPRSLDYRTFRRDVEREHLNHVIVAGGESLNAIWNTLYSYISPIYSTLNDMRGIRRLLFNLEVARKLLGGKSEFPFTVNRPDFDSDLKILYNSVGGTGLSNPDLFARLLNADYLAVRENITGSRLEANGVSNHRIVP